MENASYHIEFDARGALTHLSLKSDPNGANFLLASEDESWVPAHKQWGLGFISAGFARVQIEKCLSFREQGNRAEAVYLLEFENPRFGCIWSGNMEKSRIFYRIVLTVTRTLCGDGLYETYIFRNESAQYVVLDEIGLYSSFRDTYCAGADALPLHFNQHICTCGDLCYIEAERQRNSDQNLCLITLEGAFASYQLEEKNNSNVRGVVALVAKDVRIAAGGQAIFRRLLTSYTDRADFERKLTRYTGYPTIDYGQMTVVRGEAFRLRVYNAGAMTGISIEGTPLVAQDGVYSYTPQETGIYHGKIKYGKKCANLTFCAIDTPKSLLRLRAKFILNHQQMNDLNDLRYGAFMPYDNVHDEIFRIEDSDALYFGVPDRNEARERFGMGAFLALYARRTGDVSFLPALERYRDFLMRYIVEENGDIWDCYLQQDSAKYYEGELLLSAETPDMCFRIHNNAFITPFFIEMFLLTDDIFYAETAITIMHRFYEKSHIPSFIPVEDALLTAQNRLSEKHRKLLEEVQEYSRAMAESILARRDDYKADETAYEHGCPANDTRFLSDYCLAYNVPELLPAIENGVRRTRTFDGNQPHYQCNTLPIRHWDAFWFGSLELWGDTFPHWQACLSATSYFNYYLLDGASKWRELAMRAFLANFSLIRRDGSAYNCFLFHEKINGHPAARYEPLANDQDWVFYYYLKCLEKEDQFRK